MWLANQTSLGVGSLIWNFGDLHAYNEESHIKVIDAIMAESTESIARRSNPRLVYQGSGDFKASDFELEGLIEPPVSTVRPKLL